FLPTIDPLSYAAEHLVRLAVPKIVYRCVSHDSAEDLGGWLGRAGSESPLRVLVGAPSRRTPAALPLSGALELARRQAPGVIIGGIAIAERHAHGGAEHQTPPREDERRLPVLRHSSGLRHHRNEV